MDEEGFLYFQGRNDDIIKSRGEKVSPLEVEKVIHKVEGVREAAVFGVPDFVQGESVFAVVTTHKPNTLTEKEILKMCASHLELFMIPSRVAFIDEMPKSANGKIDKKALIKMFSQW
jgi:acyl-CoA synthetase (AMP-forming)/AMP-acid ligase II